MLMPKYPRCNVTEQQLTTATGNEIMHVRPEMRADALRTATATDLRWTIGSPAAATAAMPHPLFDAPMTPYEGDDQPEWLATPEPLTELVVDYERQGRLLWWRMAPTGRPSFTESLLADMHAFGDGLEAAFRRDGAGAVHPLRYLVLGSRLPGIFNLGGNLALFLDLIEAGDRARLTDYARACAGGQHRIAERFGLPVCTIALVQGDALGGGFEAALANDVIIAERSSKFGLPEVLFGLFPGMGAYSFLSRRLNATAAERIILSGRIYTAEELHDMDIVDVVAEDGEGVDAVYDFVARNDRVWGAKQALLKAKKIVQPVPRAELIDIVDLWVETAMALSGADLRRMRHLVKAQDRRRARRHAH